MKKILVVDDDASIRTLVVRALRGKAEVHEARDGLEALELVGSMVFDLALLDVMLPKADGHTVARALKKKDPKTPILFLSAKGDPQDVVKGIGSGARGYLTKPFELKELMAHVERALGKGE